MLELPFRYFYLVLDVPFLFVWQLLFWLSKSTRREQLIMSLLLTPIGPFSEILYFRDYWLPESIFAFSFFGHLIMLEDLLFAFTISGIAAVAYETWRSGKEEFWRGKVRRWLQAPAVLAAVVLVSLGLFLAGVNSIFATAFGFLVGALLILSQRKDLLSDSLLSGLVVMAIMFVWYGVGRLVFTNAEQILQQAWFLYDSPWGVKLFGIPFTELIWGFSWGAFVGPLYEFARRLKN